MRYRLRHLERVSARTSRNTDDHPGQGRPALKVICLMHIASKETTHAQTVKLTPHHRSAASLLESSITGGARGVDIQTLIHRWNQTARISLQIPVMSKSAETKTTGCAVTSGAPRHSCLRHLSRRARKAPPATRPSVAAASVDRYLPTPQPSRKMNLEGKTKNSAPAAEVSREVL